VPEEVVGTAAALSDGNAGLGPVIDATGVILHTTLGEPRCQRPRSTRFAAAGQST